MVLHHLLYWGDWTCAVWHDLMLYHHLTDWRVGCKFLHFHIIFNLISRQEKVVLAHLFFEEQKSKYCDHNGVCIAIGGFVCLQKL